VINRSKYQWLFTPVMQTFAMQTLARVAAASQLSARFCEENYCNTSSCTLQGQTYPFGPNKQKSSLKIFDVLNSSGCLEACFCMRNPWPIGERSTGKNTAYLQNQLVNLVLHSEVITLHEL